MGRDRPPLAIQEFSEKEIEMHRMNLFFLILAASLGAATVAYWEFKKHQVSEFCQHIPLGTPFRKVRIVAMDYALAPKILKNQQMAIFPKGLPSPSFRCRVFFSSNRTVSYRFFEEL